MHIESGLVRYCYPEGEALSGLAVNIPAEFDQQAAWCADNGIRLDSHLNPHLRLRQWAQKAVADHEASLKAKEEPKFNPRQEVKSHDLKARDAKKRRIKRLRKLQKQRGVR